jgi:hypothetical protein
VRKGPGQARSSVNLAPAAGLEPATKRLTADGLEPQFVLTIGLAAAVESHSESHASSVKLSVNAIGTAQHGSILVRVSLRVQILEPEPVGICVKNLTTSQASAAEGFRDASERVFALAASNRYCTLNSCRTEHLFYFSSCRALLLATRRSDAGASAGSAAASVGSLRRRCLGSAAPSAAPRLTSGRWLRPGETSVVLRALAARLAAATA